MNDELRSAQINYEFWVERVRVLRMELKYAEENKNRAEKIWDDLRLS